MDGSPVLKPSSPVHQFGRDYQGVATSPAVDLPVLPGWLQERSEIKKRARKINFKGGYENFETSISAEIFHKHEK